MHCLIYFCTVARDSNGWLILLMFLVVDVHGSFRVIWQCVIKSALRGVKLFMYLWTCRAMRWLSLPSPVVERREVLTRRKAEKERSLTALVAGMTSISLPGVQISLSRSLRAFPSD